jgi:SSS family solute:Na+ symporter
MQPLDWIFIVAYALFMLGIGLWLSRRAGRSADDWLVAGRKLPWWVIGFSDVASAAGADALWVLVVFSGAFIGLHRFFWIGAILAIPLAILWARYWRRLGLASAGALYEARYRGVAAARYRGFYALYGSILGGALVLGYVFQGMAQALAPFFGWPPEVVLAVFCGITLIYTLTSGLLGVAYTDVPQFLLLTLGQLILAWLVVDAAGGYGVMVAKVEAYRGPEFMALWPPADSDLYGKFKVEPLTLGALALMGLFGVAGTRSITVQRSLAARSEADAALGQIFAAVMNLVVRVAPLVVIGLAAVALLPDGKPAEVWATLVRSHAGPGLLGLILVGILAGYMSTIDTYLNFMAANVFNDFWRRHIQPDAGPRMQVRVCRIATVLLTGVAWLWATVLIGEVDADWLNFINSVLSLFVLPLGLLRWVWWRINIWGEIAGLIGGAPLAYLVWFVLDFKDAPYWQGFAVLFAGGLVVVAAVSLLTRPEPMEVLVQFWRTVRPPGWWGPVKAAAGARGEERAEWRADLKVVLAGMVFCATLVLAVSAALALRWEVCLPASAVVTLAALAFYRAHVRGNQARARRGAPQ